MASTPALRNIAKDALVITAIIADNQIGNMSMALVTTTVHNTVLSTIEAEGTWASMKDQ